ncbi:helix-turn-helix transcriptional regulator [Kordiimonas sp.]|uniref:helix-turn-helix transcriptional regulator n=1 Tax=Kordiimonas sp. TaxID=1970157 RepID=UPI003A90494C
MAKATKIKNNIRTLRFMAGEMTQAALAKEIGMTRQTIIAIEQERYSPSLEAAFQIARALNKPLEEVFEYVDDVPESDE